MDPLTVLRDYTIRGDLDKIVTVYNEFRFGNDYIFPCSVETAYKSKQGNLYTLETLVFFIKNQNLSHVAYMQSARTNKIPSVTLPDRKPLLDYLTGKVASSDSIVFIAPHHQYNPSGAQEGLDVNVAYKVYEESTGIDINERIDKEDDKVGDFGDTPMENVSYMEMIKAGERPLKDRETLLECKHKDFYSVLVKRDEDRQRMETHPQVRKDGDDMGTRGYDSMPKPKMNSMKGSKIGEGVPIILVPSAFQTLITIYNVKEFLEDGVFIPTDVKVKQMAARPDCITVRKNCSRDRDKVMTAYEVRDKPSALKPEDWDRVVAVFVLGKEWQFKDWPFKNHLEVFNKIIGFFIRFEDDSIESAKTVKQWNVKIISISKNKRHQDRTAALEVWEKLEQFMRARSHS